MKHQQTLSTRDDHPMAIALAMWMLAFGLLASFFSVFYNTLHQHASFNYLQRIGVYAEGVITEVTPYRMDFLVRYAFVSNPESPVAQTWVRDIVLSPQQYQLLPLQFPPAAVGTRIHVVYDPQNPQASVLLLPHHQFNYREQWFWVGVFLVSAFLLCFCAVHVSQYSWIVWKTGVFPAHVSRFHSLVMTLIIVGIVIGLSFIPYTGNWYAQPCPDTFGRNTINCFVTNT